MKKYIPKSNTHYTETYHKWNYKTNPIELKELNNKCRVKWMDYQKISSIQINEELYAV